MSKLLSTRECAERKGVSRQAVHLAIRANRLPAEQAGRYWVVNEEDCDAWEPNLKRSAGGKRGAKKDAPAPPVREAREEEPR